MTDIKKRESPSSNLDLEKNTTNANGSVYSENISEGPASELLAMQEGFRLKRDLKARHVSMIAIGGSLGSGLLLGTTAALANAGPANILIAYSLMGFLVYMVMCCLGEMATYITLPDGFTGYATRYCDPAVGFAVGFCYLCKYFIVTPNQLTAGALVMQYWVPCETLNPGVWVAIILVIIVVINIFGVRFFGEFEFWLSCFKVVAVLGLIILLLVIALGGGPNHDRLGFRYWQEPGAFKPYSKAIDGDLGKFVSFVSVLVVATFSYSGTELVGIVVGEAENGRRNIPRAIRLTLYRIVVFYICSVLLLGMCVAYNDPLLIQAKKSATSASASAFVVAIKNAGIRVLPHIMNGVILLFIFSAANSDLYIASRTLYGLAVNGKAPKIFAQTNRWGIPWVAMILCIGFCCLAFMCVSSGSNKVFGYFVNVVSIFGLLTWMSVLITYISFTKACKAQGIDKKTFAYVAPLQPYGTYIALAFCILICLIKNFTVFLGLPHAKFDYKTFITGYIGLPVYVICYVGYKLVTKCKAVKPEEADMYTYKDIMDLEEEQGKIEEELREQKLAESGKDLKWFYEKVIGLIF